MYSILIEMEKSKRNKGECKVYWPWRPWVPFACFSSMLLPFSFSLSPFSSLLFPALSLAFCAPSLAPFHISHLPPGNSSWGWGVRGKGESMDPHTCTHTCMHMHTHIHVTSCIPIGWHIQMSYVQKPFLAIYTIMLMHHIVGEQIIKVV